MFENFPYTDMHQLNLDWIIKIAKDFLDQYTHIQQLIEDGETSLQNLTESGLQQLQDKADNLEGLLQAWYNEHSEDIANQLAGALEDLNAWYTEHSADISDQLADALADLNAWYTQHEDYLDNILTENITAFDNHADQKAEQTIASIPDDYTTLARKVDANHNAIHKVNIEGLTPILAIFSPETFYPCFDVIGTLTRTGTNTAMGLYCLVGREITVGKIYKFRVEVLSGSVSSITVESHTAPDFVSNTPVENKPVFKEASNVFTCLYQITDNTVNALYTVLRINTTDTVKIRMCITELDYYDFSETIKTQGVSSILGSLVISNNIPNKYDLTITPSNASFGIDFRYFPVIGTYYKVAIKKTGAGRLEEVLYNTTDSWASGSQADMDTYIERYNNLDIVHFIVKSNTPAASHLIFRYINGDLNPVNLTFEFITNDPVNFDLYPQYLAFIGDSLTAQGYWGYVESGELLKRAYAVGGEGIKEIFYRTNINGLYISNEFIVNGAQRIYFEDSTGTPVYNLFGQGMGNINPVTIAGIKGVLSCTEANVYYFTPSETIETTRIYHPLLIPSQSELNINTYVFWCGTNNMSDNIQESAEWIFNQWKRITETYPNSIILGLTRDSNYTYKDICTATDQLGEAFGGRFLPIRRWLVKNGLDYCGLTPTATDSEYIADGLIPPSLLSDSVHLNTYGKQCVAHLVTEKLKQLHIV